MKIISAILKLLFLQKAVTQNLTFYKDFQPYTLDVEQDGKFYYKALKKEVDLYPCSKGTMILIGF